MNLTALDVSEYLEKVADATPAPGGGSVAALVGSLAAALCRMTAGLSLGKTQQSSVWEEMRAAAHTAGQILHRLLELVDRDASAYNAVISAFKLPRDTAALAKIRREQIQAATFEATLVPMETLRILAQLSPIARIAVYKGNPNCICDAAVAVQLIRAAAIGAAYNVRVNLAGLIDKTFADRVKGEMISLRDEILLEVLNLEKRIEESLPN